MARRAQSGGSAGQEKEDGEDAEGHCQLATPTLTLKLALVIPASVLE
jgi:hypothetical protein